MTRLRVHNFSVSLDGWTAGPRQDLQNPLGVGGIALHEWIYPTRTFRRLFEGAEGDSGVDNEFADRGFVKSAPGFWGATCSGRIRRLGSRGWPRRWTR